MDFNLKPIRKSVNEFLSGNKFRPQVSVSPNRETPGDTLGNARNDISILYFVGQPLCSNGHLLRFAAVVKGVGGDSVNDFNGTTVALQSRASPRNRASPGSTLTIGEVTDEFLTLN
ncbi:hypothetical protein EVAR_40196_1 [Eumeta japonica]|uniref:Uncharacterized protein n=1 Tax=Eumeta variegata TaxID=151549 RepID=A0A4C1XP16_EUMVA|nr:hypothetical protein EVAR_40196_1 [Eumeta japonica]